MNSVRVKNNLVISSSDDNTVQVWNMQRQEKLWGSDLGDEANCIILRGDQVITCCRDKSVRVFALESGEELYRLEHPGPCLNADLSPNKSLMAVACDSAVVLWDIRKAVKIEQFDLGASICDLQFNSSGDKVLAGSGDGQIFKIDLL